jgi:DMATS type aromatic prenyltransferase
MVARAAKRPWGAPAKIHNLDSINNTKYWWKMSGMVLWALMEEAGYDIAAQYSSLIFHLHYIVPHLGPVPRLQSPPVWKSYMTDDFSPLEYSWNWDTPKGPPKVRYSAEPVGSISGTFEDPFNQVPTLRLQNQLSRDYPNINWGWFNIIRDTFCDLRDRTTETAKGTVEIEPQSSVFLAFELGHEINAKAYFIPVKAEQRGISRFSILTESVERLRKEGYPFPAYDYLLDFINKRQGPELEVVGVAIDLVHPDDSSFQSVCEWMTLGRGSQLPEKSRQELKDLWRLTLGLEDTYPEKRDLPGIKHYTAGVLYNFDIQAKKPIPQTKLYVPVKHYASNDLVAAHGLGTFLQSRGKARYFPRYMRALERTCTHRALSDGRGFQTYIGTGFAKDGSLSLCSYLNGEVYHPRRYVETEVTRK